MGEPLANSMGKWIAGTEAKTTEHNIFNGKKKKINEKIGRYYTVV